jgi:hypothetical protein
MLEDPARFFLDVMREILKAVSFIDVFLERLRRALL